MTPSLLVHLANLRRPRRAGHRYDPAPLAVTDLLPQLGTPTAKSTRPDLDRLSDVVSNLADTIVAGRVPLAVEKLNTFARGATSFPLLVANPTALAVHLERHLLSTDPVAALAAHVVTELAAADLTRVKQCARPECTLIFYDDTRSRTQRWHAEAPCGRLERQRRHRTAVPHPTETGTPR